MNDVKFVGLLIIVASLIGWVLGEYSKTRSINPEELTLHTYQVEGETIDVECHALMDKNNAPLMMECFSTMKE